MTGFLNKSNNKLSIAREKIRTSFEIKRQSVCNPDYSRRLSQLVTSALKSKRTDPQKKQQLNEVKTILDNGSYKRFWERINISSNIEEGKIFLTLFDPDTREVSSIKMSPEVAEYASQLFSGEAAILRNFSKGQLSYNAAQSQLSQNARAILRTIKAPSEKKDRLTKKLSLSIKAHNKQMNVLESKAGLKNYDGAIQVLQELYGV